MNLQDEFLKYGYKDILTQKDVSGFGVNLKPVIDFEHKPEELIAIYISEDKDELFFLLNGIAYKADYLCGKWDDLIRVLSIVNRKSDSYSRMKYNVIQLIICSNDSDKSKASDLSVSRKIFINGDIDDNNGIDINENEEVELPFYDIDSDKIILDVDKVNRLRKLLPEDTELLSLLRNDYQTNGRITDFVFQQKEFNQIKEWIEKW